MALEKPKSASDLRYFTRKNLGNGAKVTLWVFAPKCPKCNEGRLSTPYDDETGRYKSRAKNFECAKCGFQELKKEIIDAIPTVNIEYTCPHCMAAGEQQAPFKRNAKKVFTFKCDKCSKDIKVESGKKKE